MQSTYTLSSKEDLDRILAEYSRNQDKGNTRNMKIYRSILIECSNIKLQAEEDSFSVEIHIQDSILREFILQDKHSSIRAYQENEKSPALLLEVSCEKRAGIMVSALNHVGSQILPSGKIILRWQDQLIVAERHESGSAKGWLLRDEDNNGVHFLEHFEMLERAEKGRLSELKNGVFLLKQD